MKKRICFSLLLFPFIFLHTNAQSVQWADESPNTAKWFVNEVAGYTSKSVFLVKKTPEGGFSQSKFFMDRYDLPNMNKVWTKEIWGTDDGTDKGKSLHIFSAYCLSGGVLVVATSHDHSSVYAMQLRADDGVLLDSRKVTVGDIGAGDIAAGTNFFKFAMSKDQSTLIGYYVGRHSPIIHAVAIDANLNIKWRKDIMPSFSNNDFDLKEVASLKGNDIGILVSIKDKGSDQKYRYVTVYYNQTTGSQFETRMDLGGEKLIDGINFDMDDAGNPVAAGMYKNDGEKGLFGTFGFRIDAKSGKILATASTEFTKDFLTNFESAKKADKGKGVPTLIVNEIYMTADNDIVITAERFTAITYTSGGMNGGMSSSTTTFSYKDVVLAKLDGKSCQTQWVIILPKKQETVNNLKESYGFTIQGNTIYVAFDDNRKNAEMDPKVFTEDADKLKTANLDDNGKDLVMAVCTVDIGSGDNTRKYVTNYKLDDSKLAFNALTLSSLPNTIFVYRGDRKTDQAGVLNLH